MSEDNSISKWFGVELAELLSDKILKIFKEFDSSKYTSDVRNNCLELSYTDRIKLHSKLLKKYLPSDYDACINILVGVMGDENPNETGMFKEYYWLMPVGQFIQDYGLYNYDTSIYAIQELTKRNTGEYAIRPFLKKYPQRTIKTMKNRAKSESFHLRRLASEGSRPKLPWSFKLDVFIDDYQDVFDILEVLKEDEVKFVKKSVANNIADYLKVNKQAAIHLLKSWSKSSNKNTKWIIKHAIRKCPNVLG